MNYKDVHIPLKDLDLKGRLRIAENQKGMVIFSHGSGSSRKSSRNNYVADLLLKEGFSSLLFDLLTETEDTLYENRFDIDLIAERLVAATQWIIKEQKMQNIPIGFFGASTGAAAALKATPFLEAHIKAIVSRGGRPDLAADVLSKIKVPTLLIVGGNDGVVIDLNRDAFAKLSGIKELKIIEGATHLFSEPGKLKDVAESTSNWFAKHLK